MMRRGTALAILGSVMYANAVSADDIFPTYRDDMEESERLGVISLTGTTANYTINLTGILLLGLSLAAAVTLWAYLHTFFAKGVKGYGGDSYGYGGGSSYGGSSYKRSADDPLSILPVVLSNMHQRFEEAAVEGMPCRQRIVCETAHPGQSHEYNTFGHAVNTFFSQVDKDETLQDKVNSDKRAKAYFDAWKAGKQGKICKSVYDKCSLPKTRITTILQAN